MSVQNHKALQSFQIVNFYRNILELNFVPLITQLSVLCFSIKYAPDCSNMDVSVNEGINVSRHVKVFSGNSHTTFDIKLGKMIIMSFVNAGKLNQSMFVFEAFTHK